jgi:hypothetical protein
MDAVHISGPSQEMDLPRCFVKQGQSSHNWSHTIRQLNVATENGPFMDDLAIFTYWQ